MNEITEACCSLIDQLDHYFKDATPLEATRLKLAVIYKMEATIRYDRKVENAKKFVQYQLPL
jgi:hypothetical protein